MSATAKATWKVFFSRSDRPMASALYPSSAAAARTRSTIAGLAPEPCSAREVEARETPARSATWSSVARVDVIGYLVVRSWKRFQLRKASLETFPIGLIPILTFAWRACQYSTKSSRTITGRSHAPYLEGRLAYLDGRLASRRSRDAGRL